MKFNKIYKCIKLGLVISSVSTCGSAYAQSIPNIGALTLHDIQNSGLNNLEEIISELVWENGSVKNKFSNPRNIRADKDYNKNLKIEKTVVLLNGKRLGSGIYEVFDFSNIPLSIIKEIHFNRSGYKAISITGGVMVIDIITVDDYQGLQVNAYYGKSERGDAGTHNVNVSMGVNNDKASLFFNAEFAKNSPIWAGDREISKYPKYATGNTLGSTGTPQGRFIIYDADGNWQNDTTTPGSNGFNTPNDPDLIPFTDETRFNYAPENTLLPPQERGSIYIKGKYQLSKKISLNTEALFSSKESFETLAPTPLFIGDWGGGYGEGYGYDTRIGIGGENPYNPYSYDLTPGYSYSGGLWFLGRRMMELGNREIRKNKDSYYYSFGLEGSVDAGVGWDWSANYSSSRSDESVLTNGLLNAESVRQSLSNECVFDDTCVPLNLFGGEGTITQDMLDYISASVRDESYKQLDVINLQMLNNSMQIASRDIGLKAVFEYRKNIGWLKYDNQYPDLTLNQDLRSAMGFNGDYDVNTLLISSTVPLLNDSSNQKLTVDLTAGYEKYSFTQSEMFYDASILYSPVESVQLGVSYSKTNLAPALLELFLEPVVTNDFRSDPCDSSSLFPILLGCPTGFVPNGNNDSLYRVDFKGNDRLHLEALEVYSLNIAITPESIENLSINLNYYKQSVKNIVSTVGVGDVLNYCVFTGTIFCDQIIRRETQPFYIRQVITGYVNFGQVDKSAVGLSVNYIIENNWADIELDWSNNFITKLQYSRPDYKTDDDIVLDQLDGSPDLYSNWNINLSKNNWSFNYQMRYIAGPEEKCDPRLNLYIEQAREYNADVPQDFLWCTYDSPDYSPRINPDDLTEYHDRRHISSSTIHDINLKYNLPQYNMSMMIGVENLFDRAPPLSSNAIAHSFDTNTYSATGRFYWLRISKDF